MKPHLNLNLPFGGVLSLGLLITALLLSFSYFHWDFPLLFFAFLFGMGLWLLLFFLPNFFIQQSRLPASPSPPISTYLPISLSALFCFLAAFSLSFKNAPFLAVPCLFFLVLSALFSIFLLFFHQKARRKKRRAQLLLSHLLEECAPSLLKKEADEWLFQKGSSFLYRHFAPDLLFFYSFLSALGTLYSGNFPKGIAGLESLLEKKEGQNAKAWLLHFHCAIALLDQGKSDRWRFHSAAFFKKTPQKEADQMEYDSLFEILKARIFLKQNLYLKSTHQFLAHFPRNRMDQVRTHYYLALNYESIGDWPRWWEALSLVSAEGKELYYGVLASNKMAFASPSRPVHFPSFQGTPSFK